MGIKRGIAVSAGVAYGRVVVLDTNWLNIPNRNVSNDQTKSEIDRLRKAMAAAAQDSREYQVSVNQQLGRHYGAIFEAHALLLEDPSLIDEATRLIEENAFSAEYAFTRVTNRYAQAFQNLQGNLSLASRAADLADIERRVLSHLMGERRKDLESLEGPVIVLAHDLTPSETAQLDTNSVQGFATEAGGRTSHTAIIAGALEIPALVGVGSFLSEISSGDDAIIDGNRGLLIINPDEETRRQYESDRASYATFEQQLDELRDVPAVTKDGVKVTLLGNIEFPHETSHVLEKGAEGIGLYRTEFLYLGRTTDPMEEEHYQAYTEVLRLLPKGQPLVIRTLDVGGDKFQTRTGHAIDEQNPFLGLRSIRLCLQSLGLFKTQLRAILRAGLLGSVRILFPMIATLRELRQCKLVLSEVKEDLDDEGIQYGRDVPIGTMIEVPSAAIVAAQLVREVDYLSIGTNDLVQYLLAADRTNEHVAELYNAADPAVLQLIQQVLDAGKQAGKPVNACGEMSGEPIYTALLLGMGLRQFSVTPHHIPGIKRIVCATSILEAEQVAREALRLETATEVTNYLRDQMRRLLPDSLL
ncbi:MAG: phosphoenolpyruvate--protein phosphotransferase [Gemmataceae bacterium]